MAKRPALGRGLGALLSDAGLIAEQPRPQRASGSGPAAMQEIPLAQIVPNPYQPRENFDPEALQELSDSIRSLGIIQPLTLRQTGPDSYLYCCGRIYLPT